jgi:NAD(P)-dependent dehydrogenase (short-subunit alcohol dehydrogenase family)
MFTYELQRRLADRGTTIAVAAHPGMAATELMRHMSVAAAVVPLFSQGPDMGALPVLRAASDPGVTGGQYYGPDGFLGTRGYPELVRSSRQSHDAAVQRRLWTVSEELTGVTYPV